MYDSFLNDFRQIVKDSADNAVSGIDISGLVDDAVSRVMASGVPNAVNDAVSGLDIASAVNHAVNKLNISRTTEFFVSVAMHKARIPEKIQEGIDKAVSQIELELPTGYCKCTCHYGAASYRQVTGDNQATGYNEMTGYDQMTGEYGAYYTGDSGFYN